MRSGIFSLRLLAFFSFVLFCAFELPSFGLATTYYVATNGNDSYNGLYPSSQGGSNGPFRTLDRAAYKVKAGDTVQIRAGTYHETVTWSANGTAANRITIANYNDETVVIDGGYTLPGGSVYNYLVVVSGDYVTLRDISIKRSTGCLLALSGDYSRAINVIGQGSRETGMVAGGNHNLFDGCTMIDSGNGYDTGGQTSWGSAICTVGDNTTIQNCLAYENRGEGLNAYSNSTQAVIQDNIAYDNQSYNLYADSAHGVTIQRNIVYQTKSEYLMNGITIGAETGQPSDVSVYNNFVMGCRVNFEIDSNVTNLSNVKVAYNTFVNSVGGIADYTMGVYYRPNINTYSNSIFKNNIVIEEKAGRVPISVESTHNGLTFSCNCWNKTPRAAAQGTGDVIEDPKLAKTGPTGPGLLTPEWFKILASSPARDQATVLSEVSEDFFKTPRGSAPDMGAHEIRPPTIRTPIIHIGFGNVSVGSTLDQTTNITNDGESVLTINSIVRASGSAEFAYAGPSTPFTLEAGGSQAVTVRFSPSSAGAKAAVFKVSSNDPDQSVATFDVSGTGTILIDFTTPSKNLSLTDDGNSEFPKVASVPGTGNVFVIWVETVGDNDALFFSRSADGGNTWTVPLALSSMSGQILGRADDLDDYYALSLDVDNPFVHIVMQKRNTASDDFIIYYMRSPNLGQTWGSWIQLTSNSADTRHPDVAAKSGYVHVVYQDSGSGNNEIIYKRILNNGGGTVDQTRRLTSSSGNSCFPRIAVSKNGDTVNIVYEDNQTGQDQIYYKHIDNFGAGSFATRQLTSGSSWSGLPDIATSTGVDDQYVYVVYQALWPGNREIMYMRLGNYGHDGGSIDIARLTYSTSESRSNSIAFDSNNNAVHITYHDNWPGNFDVMYRKFLNYGGAGFTGKRVSWGVGDSCHATVAQNSGVVLIVWSDNSSGNYEIYLKKGN